MIPLHLRKKLRTEKLKPKYFEVMPPIGSLMPGQRINVQVKFMPTEEVRGSLRLFGWKSVVSLFDLRSVLSFPEWTPSTMSRFSNFFKNNDKKNVCQEALLAFLCKNNFLVWGPIFT